MGNRQTAAIEEIDDIPEESMSYSERSTPPPSAPPAMFRWDSAEGADDNCASQHDECVVCFDNLHEEPCAVLAHSGRRTCQVRDPLAPLALPWLTHMEWHGWVSLGFPFFQHWYHKRCADALPPPLTCPVCRREFDRVMGIPRLSQDARGWFAAVDFDGEICFVLAFR